MILRHDGRYNQFHDFIDRDFGFVEHLGNDNHRVVASLSDTERQVSRTAAHRSQHKPVSAGTHRHKRARAITAPLSLADS